MRKGWGPLRTNPDKASLVCPFSERQCTVPGASLSATVLSATSPHSGRLLPSVPRYAPLPQLPLPSAPLVSLDLPHSFLRCPCWLPTVREYGPCTPPGALFPTGRPLQPLPLPGRLRVLPATALPSCSLRSPAPGRLLPLLRRYLLCGTLGGSSPLFGICYSSPSLNTLLPTYRCAFPGVLPLFYLGTLVRTERTRSTNTVWPPATMIPLSHSPSP